MGVRAVIHARLIVFICFKRIHANPYSKPDSVCSLINTGFSHSTVKVSVKKVLGGMVVHFHYFCLEELPTLLRAFSFSIIYSPSFLAQHSFCLGGFPTLLRPLFSFVLSFIFFPSFLARQCHSWSSPFAIAAHRQKCKKAGISSCGDGVINWGLLCRHTSRVCFSIHAQSCASTVFSLSPKNCSM